MSGISIGLSALTASELALNVIGQNITNASTPGYHRQVVNLSESQPQYLSGFAVGTGVQVESIQQMRDALADNAVTSNTSDTNNTTAQLNALQQVQTLVTPSNGSLDALLQNFFSQLTQLASQPNDIAQRQVTLNDAQSLAQSFNSLANNLGSMQGSVMSQLSQSVDQINQLAPQIAALNGQIQTAQAAGVNANDLMDQRSQLINQVAQDIDVQTISGSDGQTSVLVGGVPLVLGTTSTTLQLHTDQSDNTVSVQAQGSQEPLTISGGTIAGLLQVRNQALPGYSTQLNTLAQTLAQGLDEIQATGMGLSGGQSFLGGNRSVQSISAPLSQAGLALPMQAGSLWIGVTDTATGQRTLSQVNIDPATQSLQDVANAISGVSHLQGLADPQTGTLEILAQPGYQFDFAGGMPSAANTTNLTGTTVPTIGGSYTGATNDNYTFSVSGAGTVGVTPNLNLQVTNSAGTVLASLNIGQGYSPGSTLQVANGVTVSLASGTVNAGDSFATPVVGQPDTANALSALGFNTLFTGTNASNLAVNPNLLANPQNLSAGLTAQPGDASNLQRMINLSSAPLLNNSTQTLAQYYDSIVGNVGTQVQSLTQLQSTQQATGQQLATQQQSVSGVDPNQEMVNLLQFQRAFQSASEYINEVNHAMNDVFQILT